jgi:hypothetical protein
VIECERIGGFAVGHGGCITGRLGDGDWKVGGEGGKGARDSG